MELNIRLVIFIAINYYLGCKIVCAGTVALEHIHEVSDNFGQDEVDLLNEAKLTDRQDRELIIKELNETLEYFENSGGNTSKTTHMQTNANALMTNLIRLQKNQNEIIRMVNDVITNQAEIAARDNDIINSVGVLQNLTQVLSEKYEMIEQALGAQGSEITMLANVSKSAQLELQNVHDENGHGYQGPVVQSIVSLTSSLTGQLVKCFMTL